MLLYLLLERHIDKGYRIINKFMEAISQKNADAENNNAGAEHILAPKKSSNKKPSSDPPKPSQPINIPKYHNTRIKLTTNSNHVTPSLTPPTVWGYNNIDKSTEHSIQ